MADYIMKAEDLKNHLPQYKQRAISELIRFIDTKNETSASYNVFLGAGASVSSGIRSGVDLVEVWRKEQYEKLNPSIDREYDTKEAKDWLSRNCMEWYSHQKEYSSLFQRAYDTPRQRRIFVEREVSGKFPSLGYTYLIRLVESKYFETIFTTNFDDLINEAFYQFSHERPIICAHDSSIKNATFNSKRPKIIKLHGDYLFDDIKTTLRETESLEKNIRDKFEELSKEVGLIVVGFAGNDRSIMDVIEFLAKDENYLKNGIYWCLRKEDVVSEEVKKILWNDKVFWVEIEGFDQFFAELYLGLCGDDSPVKPELFNQQSSKIYEQYLTNKFLKHSDCKVIQRHLSLFEKEKNRNVLVDLLKPLTIDDNDSEESDLDDDFFSFENQEIRYQYYNLEKDKKYSEVISFVNQTINKISNNDLKEWLLNRAYLVAKRLFNNQEAKRIAEKLIEIDPKDVRYLRLKAKSVEDLDEKIEVLNQAINLNKFSYQNYLRKAECLIEKAEGIIGSDLEKTKAEIIECLESAIKLNPSIENEAWKLKFQLINDWENEKNKESKLLEIIEKINIQSEYSPIISELIFEFCKIRKIREFKDQDIITLLKQNTEKYYPTNDLDNCLVLIDAYCHYEEKEQLETYLLELDLDKKIKNKSRYILRKAKAVANVFADIPKAIEIIVNYRDFDQHSNLITFLINLYISNEEFEKAQELLDKYSLQISEEVKIALQSDIFDSQNKHQEAIDFYKKSKKERYSQRGYYLQLSYYYLRKKDYHTAKKITKEFLDTVNFNIKYDDLILNYEFATLKLGNNLHKDRITQVLNSTKDKRIKIVCNYLLNNKDRIIEELKDYWLTNFMESSSMIKWAIFDDFKENLIKIREQIKSN